MSSICTLQIKIIIILAILVQTYGSLRLKPNYYNGNHTRVKRQSNPCGGSDETKFQCRTSSDCIDNDQQCNGVADCPDGSDETKQVCEDIICPGYLFRCDYGACVSSHYKCDGKQDCLDNSDEKNCGNNNCRSDQYQCDNNECIDIDGRCNGVADCSDGSDENEALCLNVNCPGYTFKCKYGACVDGTAQCNGIKECHDNSDEDESICTQPVVNTTSPPIIVNGPTCTTPAQPSNGHWKYWNGIELNTAAVANEKVNPGTQIIFKCSESYQLSSSNDRDQEIFYCQENGEWHNGQINDFGFPKCLVLCEKYYNDYHAILECKRDKSVIPCDRATHGTKLTFKCDYYYEPSSEYSINYCSNGLWSYEKPKCKEVCGEKRVTAQPLIINGKIVERGNYPWVVAMYMNENSNFKHICGGSLLTAKYVLTAAHCVANAINGIVFNKELFHLAAGKYYNKYKDLQDNDTAQYRKVSNLIKHDEFRGADSSFRSDIAILKADKEFFLSRVVQPVCFRNLPPLGDVGEATVTGWGLTKSSSAPSNVLKEINIQYVQPNICLQQQNRDSFYRRYLFNSDKICGGSVDGTGGACQGDSGGGLVVRHNKNDRYFIQGVVSLNKPIKKPDGQHCSTEQPVLFTYVKQYKRWIDESIAFLDGQE